MDQQKITNRAEMIKILEETLQQVKRWEWDGVIVIKQKGEHTKLESNGIFHPAGVRSVMAEIKEGLEAAQKEKKA